MEATTVTTRAEAKTAGSAKYYNPIQERLDKLPLSRAHFLIWLMSTLGWVVDSMDLYMISFALPLIIKEWHLSSATAGILASAAMWGMLIGSWLWGILCDKIGRRASLQSTIGIFSAVSALCALAWNSTTLFIGRLVVGTGLGGLVPVDYALQAEFFPAKYRGRMISASVAFWPLGGLLGALFAFNLVPIWGWRSLFVAGALPAILIFFVRLMLPESPRFLIDRGRNEEAAKVLNWMEQKSGLAPSTDLNVASMKVEKQKSASISELFSDKSLRFTLFLASGLWLIQSVPYFGMMLWLPTLMVKNFGFAQPQALKVMMLISVVGCIARLFTANLIDSWGRKPVIITFGIGAAIGMFGFSMVQGATQFLAVVVFAIFCYECMWAIISPYTAEIFPTRLRSTGSGFASGMGRIASALSPMYIGFLVDRSVNAVFYTFSALSFLLVVFLAVFMYETKGKALEEISN